MFEFFSPNQSFSWIWLNDQKDAKRRFMKFCVTVDDDNDDSDNDDDDDDDDSNNYDDVEHLSNLTSVENFVQKKCQ